MFYLSFNLLSCLISYLHISLSAVRETKPALEQRWWSVKTPRLFLIVAIPWLLPVDALRHWNIDDIREAWWDWQKHWMRKFCLGKWELWIQTRCGRKCVVEYAAANAKEMLVCLTFQPSACKFTDKLLPAAQTSWALCLKSQGRRCLIM